MPHALIPDRYDPRADVARLLPRKPTPGQLWRFRRNVAIAVGHRGGLSQRFLADVFELPRSRIAAILREIEEHMEARPEAGRSP